MRFNKASFAVIDAPSHASVFNGRPEQRMGLQQHLSIFDFGAGSGRTRKMAGGYFLEI